LQDWLNLLTLVTGGTALSLTFGLLPEEQILSGAFAAVSFGVLYSLLRGLKRRELVMCPVIDMANHQGSKGAELSYEFFSDRYTVAAGEAYRSGEEVFISYGTQTTDSLFQRFGFVEPDNALDTYTFYGVDRQLQERAPAERWAAVCEAVDKGTVPALGKVATDNKARLDDRVIGAMRYLLGVTEDLSAALEAKAGKADRAVFEFVLELALVEPGTKAGDINAEQAALKMAKKMGKSREALAHQYNLEKFRFLQARIEQLRRRIDKM
jgi:hypothetical protein